VSDRYSHVEHKLLRAWLRPHDHAGRSEGCFGVTDGVFAEVKDRRGGYGIGVTIGCAFHEVVQVDPHRVGRARQNPVGEELER
jgi:hypothetical protein